jgi:hypothetical protein
MAKRARAATVDVGLRIKEPMRARLERVAKMRGMSMNAEIVDRLNRSFVEDDFLGGHDLRIAAALMTAAFNSAGSRAAQAKGIKDNWTRDADCYLSALSGMIDTMLNENAPPDFDDEKKAALILSLQDRIMTRRLWREDKDSRKWIVDPHGDKR